MNNVTDIASWSRAQRERKKGVVRTFMSGRQHDIRIIRGGKPFLFSSLVDNPDLSTYIIDMLKMIERATGITATAACHMIGLGPVTRSEEGADRDVICWYDPRIAGADDFGDHSEVTVAIRFEGVKLHLSLIPLAASPSAWLAAFVRTDNRV